MSTRPRRLTALAGALALAVSGAVVTAATPAQAVVVGTSTISPATGHAAMPQNISTDGPCSEPAAAVRTKAWGFGFPEAGQVITVQNEISFSTTDPMTMPISNAWMIYGENLNTYLDGTYDVRVQCVNRFGTVVYDEYQTYITFKTPGNSVDNLVNATYTTSSTPPVEGPTEFTNDTTPTFTGTARVGGTVTATPGTWTPAPETTAYQWLRAGAPIAGATSATYRPVAADAGKALSVRVTVGGAGLPAASATSPARVVAAGTFVSTAKPKVKGKKRVGTRLTANVGRWSPSPTTTKVEWLRGKKVVSTGAKYKLKKKDLKKKISIRVTVSAPGFESAKATSKKYKVKKKLKKKAKR